MTEGFMEHDHADLALVFQRLDDALGERDIALASELLDLAWARLAVHIRAEHLHLFPAIQQALSVKDQAADQTLPSAASVRETIARLLDDHNFLMHEFADAIKTMRKALTDKSELDSSTDQLEIIQHQIRGIIKRLNDHNQIEESEVYRWPKTLLDKDPRARLYADMLNELQNMPPRFANLHLLSGKSVDGKMASDG